MPRQKSKILLRCFFYLKYVAFHKVNRQGVYERQWFTGLVYVEIISAGEVSSMSHCVSVFAAAAGPQITGCLLLRGRWCSPLMSWVWSWQWRPNVNTMHTLQYSFVYMNIIMVIKVIIENPHPLIFPSGVIVGAAVGKKLKNSQIAFCFFVFFQSSNYQEIKIKAWVSFCQ